MKTSIRSRQQPQGTGFVESGSKKSVERIGYLRLVSDEVIMIEQTDGLATICKAEDVFTGLIDENFKEYGTDVGSGPTKEMRAQIFEMIRSGTLAQIFGSLGKNLDRLCLRQSQIISFVQKHEKWFRAGRYTISFLLGVENRGYFVARVSMLTGEFYVNIRRLSDRYVWPCSGRFRFVVPRL